MLTGKVLVELCLFCTCVRLTHNVSVMGLSLINDPCCFLEQETSPLLLSTGEFQEWIRV